MIYRRMHHEVLEALFTWCFSLIVMIMDDLMNLSFSLLPCMCIHYQYHGRRGTRPPSSSPPVGPPGEPSGQSPGNPVGQAVPLYEYHARMSIINWHVNICAAELWQQSLPCLILIVGQLDPFNNDLETNKSNNPFWCNWATFDSTWASSNCFSLSTFIWCQNFVISTLQCYCHRKETATSGTWKFWEYWVSMGIVESFTRAASRTKTSL